MKNRFIRKIILIIIIMLILIGINCTIVNAATYKITKQTKIYYVDQLTGDYSGSSSTLAVDQELEAETSTATIQVNGNAVYCRKINSDTLKLATGGTVSKLDGLEWYMTTASLEEVESSGSSSGGYGTSGAYGTGEVVIDTDEDSGRGGGGLTDMTQDGALDEYKSTGVQNAGSLAVKTNVIVGIVQAIGTVIAVIMLTMIAIKYMVSSIEERADYKQTMIPFVIGAGSLLIVSNLVGIIYSIIENINV